MSECDGGADFVAHFRFIGVLLMVYFQMFIEPYSAELELTGIVSEVCSGVSDDCGNISHV
jgi:hypothetical protein